MNFNWDSEKNKLLKQERNICFEDVATAINSDKVLDAIKHPNQERYPNQKIYILELQGYIHMIPFVKSEKEIFLKTIIPNQQLLLQQVNTPTFDAVILLIDKADF